MALDAGFSILNDEFLLLLFSIKDQAANFDLLIFLKKVNRQIGNF